LLPRLSGISDRDHVALTYDDGPHGASTPAFLDLLDAHGLTATFFLLGAHLDAHRSLVLEMADRGHELAVHGWDHRCVALKRSGQLHDEVRRTVDLLQAITGRQPTWYRPPYGVLTTESLRAARSAGLRTVLWSAWGRDWSRAATPASVRRTVTAALRPGGTVLLHDTDRTSAPGSWRTTLAASEGLFADWAARGLAIGPLGRHW
jgi:peptidoglycan/xylan/chitin deacetylase (PgdA/CDA1 family)